jgi:isopenicillin-N epimerase
VHFLNHGSFGATPRTVQRVAGGYRAQMERQPVAFLQQELPLLLAKARAALASYLNAQADDVAFVSNATVGVNIAARSLEPLLQPGDEVLTTNHEYGACSNGWEATCARTGARYVRLPLPMPDEEGGDAASIVETLWAGVTERTRVLFLSHITSPTALCLPIAPLLARARAAGIYTVVDGAHAPGQIALDLPALDADFYTGNCHKWLCAPKGAGFLHVRANVQPLVQPLVVSWGNGPERQFFSGNDMQDALGWSGTNDFSAWLAVPAAIRFAQKWGWDGVRARSAALLDAWLPRYAAIAGLPPIYAAGDDLLRPPQVAVAPLPAQVDAALLKTRLLDDYAVEVPIISWRNRKFVRVSIQGYTTEADLAALEDALRVLLAT